MSVSEHPDIHAQALGVLQGWKLGARPAPSQGAVAFALCGPAADEVAELVSGEKVIAQLDSLTRSIYSEGLPRLSSPGLLDLALAQRLLSGYALVLSNRGFGQAVMAPGLRMEAADDAAVPGLQVALAIGPAQRGAARASAYVVGEGAA